MKYAWIDEYRDRNTVSQTFRVLFHRFGSQYQSPELRTEKALNFDLAISDRLSDNWLGEAVIFHNKIDDLMQSVVLRRPTRTKNESVGTGMLRGLELSLNGFIMPTLEIGGNYTYTDIDIHLSSKSNGSSTLTKNGVPRHKGMLYTKWQPLMDLQVIPSI